MAVSEDPGQGCQAEVALCTSSADQLLPSSSTCTSPTAAAESELVGALLKPQEENWKHVDVLVGRVKEELAAHADPELEEMRMELEVNRGRLEEAQQQLAAVQQDKSQMEQEVASLRERVAAAEEETHKAAEMAAALKKAGDEISRLKSERSEMDKMYHEMINNFIIWLKDARSQRDEARGRVLHLENQVAEHTASLQVRQLENQVAEHTASLQMAQLDKLRTDTLNGAAITIQRFVRGMLARRRFTVARAAVVKIQCAVRAWAARKLASQLRREKAALITIQVKMELAALDDLERQLEELRAKLEVVNRGQLEESQQQVAAVQQNKGQMKQEVASLRERVAAVEEMAAALREARGYTGHDKKFHDMGNDLITRLQNTCSQRDGALGQRVLELENKDAKLPASLQVVKDGELAAASTAAIAVQSVQSAACGAATGSAASPGPVGTPVARVAKAMHHMLQKMQASAPGYARNVANNISGLFTKGGTLPKTSPGAGAAMADEEGMRSSGQNIPGSTSAGAGTEAD